MTNRRKGRMSLTVKLNVLILVIIVVLAGGLIAIACRINHSRVDRQFRENTEQAASAVAYFMDGDYAGRLLEALQSDDFRAAREEALAAEDGEIILRWLEEQGLYEGFQGQMQILRESRDRLGAKFVYVQSLEGEVFINLMDPNEDLFYVGSRVTAEKEFGAYRGNMVIPATISTSEYGWLCSAYQPLFSLDGKVTAMIGVDMDMNIEMRERQYFVIHVLLYSVVLIILSVLAGVLLMRRIATRPLAMLSRSAVGFAAGEKALSMDEIINLPIRSGDEIGDLYQEIRAMQGRIVEYTDHLTRVTREKERIGTELNIAAKIQADMLPRIFPPFPDRPEFDLYATMDPAREVGGDFYDFFLVDDDHIALVMADVSDKGVPAALFMVITKTLIKNQVQLGKNPAEALRNVNEQLREGNTAGLFVTVWLAVIEISTGRGLAANAGHEHPAIRRAGGKYELIVYRHSPVVGVLEDMCFPEHSFELHPGDSLFVYTDGVPEATDAQGRQFGTDRMLEALNREPDALPRELLQNVRKEIEAYKGEALQFDDITMLNYQYKGPNEKILQNH